MLHEFLLDLNKFVGQVGQTMHELQGNTACILPLCIQLASACCNVTLHKALVQA